MGLTCGCDYEPEPGSLVAYSPSDYEVMKVVRTKCCASCGTRISAGDIAAKVRMVKIPESDVECAIYGEDGEISRAPKWLCERCADIYFSLDDLGFCVNPLDNMAALLAEYQDIKAYQNIKA